LKEFDIDVVEIRTGDSNEWYKSAFVNVIHPDVPNIG
jgi:hypothetical protein